MPFSRRRLITGGAAAALAGGAGLVELEKLRGAFDNRREIPPTAPERWNASMAELSDPAAAGGSVVHVGQSTHLIVLGGKRILTDPWFYDPAFGALVHGAGPAVSPDGVGKLDYILVTHDHPDHADPLALDRLDKSATVVVGLDPLFAKVKSLGFRNPLRLEEWQGHQAAGLEIACVPGLHDVPEVGFVLRSGPHSVYFAGDSRLHPHLPAVAERYAPTTAILSVDGTRLIGSKNLWVMDPQDAVTACGILKVKAAMPSHADALLGDPLVRWGRLATTVADANRVFQETLARQAPQVRCLSPAPGERAQLLET